MIDIYWTVRMWTGAILTGIGFSIIVMADKTYPGCVQEIHDLWMARLKKRIDQG